MKCFFVSLMIIIAPILLCAHPVHVTITNVEINTKIGEGNVYFKILSADLKDAIMHWKGSHISLDDTLRNANSSLWIQEYIRSNFSISDLGIVSLKFSEHRIEEEYINLNYNFRIRVESESIEIFNSLLIDLMPDQSNLVIVTIDGKDKGLNFNAQNKQFVVDLK